MLLKRRIRLIQKNYCGTKPFPACEMLVYNDHILVKMKDSEEKEIYRPRDCAVVDDFYVDRCIDYFRLAGFSVIAYERFDGGEIDK